MLTLKENYYAIYLIGAWISSFDPCISQGRFFWLIFRSWKVDLYMSKYCNWLTICPSPCPLPIGHARMKISMPSKKVYIQALLSIQPIHTQSKYMYFAGKHMWTSTVTIGFGFTSDLITKEVTQVFQPTPQDLSGKKLGNLVKIMTIYALLYMKKIQTYNDEHASIFLPGSTAPKEWNNCNEDSSGNHNLGSWCIWNRICNGDIVSMFNKSPDSNSDQHTTKHLAQIWQLKLNLTRGRHGGIIVKNVSDSVAIILDKLKKNS